MSEADKKLRDWFVANKERVDARGNPIGLAEAAAKYVQAKKKEQQVLDKHSSRLYSM